MTPAQLSVVIVSTGRPEALRRCVLAISQLATAGCEVVVVADEVGRGAVRPFADRIKIRPQATPNIAAARNAGIEAASGEIIAFIDDDAVPEPTWADAILQAFEDPDVAAMTGPVLGRNGISMQWTSMAVNGQAREIMCDPDAPVRDGFYRKLHGTNMAFRREVFARLGGFDEAIHFYLDDTDMAMRVGRAGLKSAWVNGAVVHHGFLASARRTDDRVPLTLFDVGASTAVFLRQHGDDARTEDEIRDIEAAQSTRLLRLAKLKKLDADKMRGLMESLRDGLSAGRERSSQVPDLAISASDFTPFVSENPPTPIVLSGRSFQRGRLRREAARAVAGGQPVSLFLFEPTPRKHKVQFSDSGWWEQSGGLFGPADRSDRRFQAHSFRGRLLQEVRRISATRGL